MTAGAPTLPARLQAAAANPAAGVVFVDRREREARHSYAALFAGAVRCADELVVRGVQPGDRVAIVLPSGPAFYHALFGAMLCGAVAVPLYPPVRLGKVDEAIRQTEGMLRTAGACTLVCTQVLGDLLAPAVQRAGVALGLCPIDPTATAAAAATAGGDAAEPLAAGSVAHATLARAEDHADRLALLQFSSGTTGEPKAVALTHRQIGANVDAIVAAIHAHAPATAGYRHCTVSWLPLYHDMGLMGCVFGAITDQSDLVLLPPEAFVGTPALWLRAIGRHRASVSAAPNFAYAYCAERIDDAALTGVDLSSWRVALNGAEGVSQTSMRAFARRFAGHGFAGEAFGPVYGLAEATLAVSFALGRGLHGDAVRHGAVSLGRPLPGMAVRIAALPGDGWHAVAPGEAVGAVHVRGPSLAEGYWQADGLRPARGADGWLDTGDVGFVHDGALHLVGRAKDVVIVRGRNYGPEPIERAAQGAEGVRRGCVVVASGRRGAQSTDQVVVLAETRVAGRAARAALRAAVAALVAGKVGLTLDEVVLVAPGTLLRTSSGKLRRGASLAAYWANALQPPERFAKARLAWRLWAARVARLAVEPQQRAQRGQLESHGGASPPPEASSL